MCSTAAAAGCLRHWQLEDPTPTAKEVAARPTYLSQAQVCIQMGRVAAALTSSGTGWAAEGSRTLLAYCATCP